MCCGKKEEVMSDRLKLGLESSRSELNEGVVEAEAELARLRDRCAELETLIAMGKAAILTAQVAESTPRA